MQLLLNIFVDYSLDRFFKNDIEMRILRTALVTRKSNIKGITLVESGECVNIKWDRNSYEINYAVSKKSAKKKLVRGCIYWNFLIWRSLFLMITTSS